ncbi:MAG: nucleotidyltransferase domain-containing protein [Thaumarchaeota archaeon]|nr:nucleotidyltransferase domain-containing protein [Nitrososphaerota archaeon]MDE1877316.1 nucleotidyltransferase domain-containing protein [Nitrososphaerota archaeon]
MLLHRYLEGVLGNKASITLLRTMINYQGRIFTIRGLAEEAKVTPNEAALTIHDLERFGIVKIQPVGRAYQLDLNKKNYIFDKIIEPIIKSEKNTITELLALLKKHLDTKKIISAAIFGSVVKGQEKIDSDIDLLVVSNDRDHAIAQISEAIEQTFLIFHGSVSPIIFTDKEFKAKQKESLIRSIIDNHILICGKNIKIP